MYAVVTENGLPVYESESKEDCTAYIAQAITKGSVPGFLRIEEMNGGNNNG